tara:strand:- start:355 stop:627 length:273 start_codon:yes stop_codon:yes gene_type:complete
MSDIRELDTLWDIPLYSIEKVLLSDGIWYDISKEYLGMDCGNGVGLTIYGHFGNKPQYFELRTWRERQSGHGICIRGLVNQIQLLETSWS